jgi:hypothetical protein
MKRGAANPFDGWRVEFGLALLVGCLAAVLWWVSGRERTSDERRARQSLFAQFSEKLDQLPHECVPLGWYPIALPSYAFYPGYDASAADSNSMIPSGWLAIVRPGARGEQVKAVTLVLDELTRLGLLARRPLADGMHYSLTHEGERYYYDRNDLGHNADAWPYLCFSRLHAKRIAWSGPARRDERRMVSRSIRFTWSTLTDAGWVTPLLKARSVTLAPVSNPANAEARLYLDGKWRLIDLTSQVGVIENEFAWMSPKSAIVR